MGIRARKVHYYFQAITHSSISEDFSENNERLEYLGDAILDAIVAEYLYLKYPSEGEGFLTEMRSKIVSRQSLNSIAKDMGMTNLMHFNKSDQNLRSSHIFGNALESLIGAIYLDRGYDYTKKYILKHILQCYVDIDSLAEQDYNLKNKIISWAQKQKQSIAFESREADNGRGRKIFYIDLIIEDKIIATGSGYSKKEAGEKAAQLALEKLGIND